MHRLATMRQLMIVTCGLTLLACTAGSQRIFHAPREPDRDPQATLVRGDRTRSKNIRAIEESPKVWDDENGAFTGDRMLIEQYRGRKQAEHERQHRAQREQLRGYVHPACRDDGSNATCPLASLRWLSKNTEDGIELYGKATELQAAAIRDAVQCHRLAALREICPLQRKDLRVTVWYRNAKAVLRIVILDDKELGPVRKAIRSLIAP